ncbi:MAG: hypothetical protein GW762_02560 [Candidatus Pacebacteria bacterium]|nr:hypothetical protein [Candidatus Paceibacterota bacterium]PIR64116.1 MAG: hypothetical protein COU64_01050 [Candidatus Pacebacteria bacterium CG10_big_fil_rev_8_21_14_0_10_40_26]PIZ78468.1 MAG: hypothetical protein COY01_04430 [Candidatus Pacebacteria bacterium CG_4_10_14_0_2_um_filter_40_20]PJA69318.1 MAG: hypothetical protein CO156_00315 [Candidatus Pacebacteria bacterium CG_4_9_14_3_um_filter_40_12]PJC42001.1 MAG: hypothetical protein CO041_01870 [Candidatus Pacebacteria bacterium CG_4_9_
MKRKVLENQQFIKPAVFGATDGIITTFAVVASVAGAGLSPSIVLIMGIANMLGDGVSMGLGDYLGERSERLATKSREVSGVWKTGLVTFIAFVIAGIFPLLPYFFQTLGLFGVSDNQFELSIISTALTLFFVGSLRTIIIPRAWWKNGFEMLFIGATAASVAFLFGFLVDKFIM